MAFPVPPPPVSPRRPGQHDAALACGVAAAVLSVVMIAACSVLGTYASYASTHNVPNPWWATFGKSFCYRPEHGPPSPVFFVVRPEVVARQYVADYIGLAGTFPCAADLGSIADPDQYAEFEDNDD